MLRHERVDRLDLREEVAIVEVRREHDRLRDVLVEPGELVDRA